jgi:hypothetical protein
MIHLLRRNLATVFSAGFTLAGVVVLQFGFVATKLAQAVSYPTCGGVTYNASTQGCCGASVYNLSTAACCGSTTYTIANKACCGSSVYNLATEACCTGSTQGPTVYNVSTEGCCPCGSVYHFSTTG